MRKVNILFDLYRQFSGWQIKTALALVAIGVIAPPIKAQLPNLSLTDSQSKESKIQPSNTYKKPENAYTIGAGDVVKIDIFRVEEYSGQYAVLVDGTISLPLIGSVPVQGMTLAQMQTEIANKYSSYLKRPIISVSLVNPRPLKIAIAGEVNSPGSYNINLDEQQKFPTVTDMLEKAGGIRTTADVSQVKIQRIWQGRKQTLYVDLWDLLQNGNLNQDISLRDGDSIYIPSTQEIDTSRTEQLAQASFGIKADKPINVAIVGEVYRPGSYVLMPPRIPQDTNNINTSNKTQPSRLTQAINKAGGIKPLANIRNLELHRTTRKGEEQIINVDLWTLLQTGNLEQDLILQEGDKIIIPPATALDPTESESLASASFSPVEIKVNVVGEVNQPGSIQVPPNTPLNQAILAAGGFNERRAKKSSVELIRLNPNGTVSKRKLKIDFAQGINEENNPILQNNDVIIVKRSDTASVTDALGTILSPFNSILNLFGL